MSENKEIDTNLLQELTKDLSEEERKAVLSIVQEYSETGESKQFTDLVYADFDEIPVDITTFLHERKYLGNGLYNPEGVFTVYPYWENKLKEIFPNNIDTAYNTLILTGAIGLGKTFIGDICLLYMLYRLLCLKDPYAYYGLQPIDKLTISFMNITLENAKGVALDKLNQLIMSSDWFMSHGQMKGITNLEYVPNKHIELVAASSNNQIVGRCLDGDTQIKTNLGIRRLKDLIDVKIRVFSINDNGEEILSDECTVKQTLTTNEEYQIELENGSIIKCTPNHKFMLKDGSYKEARYLTEDDELFDYNISYKESIQNITDTTWRLKNEIKSIKKVVLDTPKQFYDVINAYPYNNFLIYTKDKFVCSHNCLIASLEDEVNFSAMTTDVEKNKKRMLDIISKVDARMKSRFLRTRNGKPYLPTLNIVISSKDSEQSFLETFIDTKRKNESKTTLIVDEAQWVVDSRKDNEIKFPVAIGNKYLANELLPENSSEELLREYRAKGYSILMVPIGYLENFKDNVDKSLTEIAGISTQSAIKYISGMRWNEIKVDSYENPFTKEIIEVGTGKEDKLQYSDFFDLTKVSSEMKSKPLYIHLDMSKGSGGKGDKTGIAGVYAVGKKPKIEGEEDSKEMFYKIAFSVSVKAPQGQEISFDKNRTFIRWLRSQGFNIKGVSADTYNSGQIKQQLIADGFNFMDISVDRVDTQTKQCLPYAYFKSTLYDRRLEVYRKNSDFLTEEVIGLERLSNGKIEHPDAGTKGSKDCVDSVVGALWHAAQDAEEFAYDFGEDISTVTQMNSPDMYKQEQLTLELEEELKKMSPFANMSPPNTNTNKQSNDIPSSFIMGGDSLVW